MNIYRDAKRRGIYPPLFTDPEGDSCFSIYQIRWIKKNASSISSLKLSQNEAPSVFSLRSQNSEYPRIFQATGANQNARKLLSTDLVNTKLFYLRDKVIHIVLSLFDQPCFFSFAFKDSLLIRSSIRIRCLFYVTSGAY